jgi:Alpha/beta hydrolase of unknown function (DUF1400).
MNFQFQQGYLNGMQPLSAHLTKKMSKSLSLGLALLLGTSAVFLSSGKAFALDNVTVKYGAIDVTLPMSDLQSLAQTGKASSQLQSVLSLAKQTPESMREILTREVPLDSQLVAGLANTYFGEIVFKQLGEVAYTPATRDSKRVGTARCFSRSFQRWQNITGGSDAKLQPGCLRS